MSSAMCFNLNQSLILLSRNVLSAMDNNVAQSHRVTFRKKALDLLKIKAFVEDKIMYGSDKKVCL